MSTNSSPADEETQALIGLPRAELLALDVCPECYADLVDITGGTMACRHCAFSYDREPPQFEQRWSLEQTVRAWDL